MARNSHGGVGLPGAILPAGVIAPRTGTNPHRRPQADSDPAHPARKPLAHPVLPNLFLPWARPVPPSPCLRTVFRQGGGRMLRLLRQGAQRASRRSGSGPKVLVAALLALGAIGAIPHTTYAASVRVVIVVGPVESKTSDYR